LGLIHCIIWWWHFLKRSEHGIGHYCGIS
jgi:hypothetical protein